LAKVADTSPGVKTGANDFFILEDQTIREFGIEQDLLLPVVTSSREFEGPTLDTSHLEHWLLDCRELVRRAIASSESPSSTVKNEIRAAEAEGRLRRLESHPDTQVRSLSEEEVRAIGLMSRWGFEGGYQYMLWGLRRGVNSNPTCASRRFWFAIGHVIPTTLVAPKNVRGRPFFPLLDQPRPVINVLYSILPREDGWLQPLAAFLNSSIGKLFFEVHGRIQRGGLVEMSGKDVKEIPVLDPRTLAPQERERIVEAYQALIQHGVREDEAEGALLALDRAVLGAFGLEDRAEEVAKVAKALSESRQEQKEYEIPVEVERVETIVVPGAVRVGARTQTALHDFPETASHR
jgi:hypothetical protein